MSNLDLWDSVKQTDLSHTKNAKIGGRNITSISPQYQRQEATSKFGPYGIGWGIIPKSESTEYKSIGDDTLIIYTATMFYVWNGERGEFPICSIEKLAYMTRGQSPYLKVDTEATKKVQTNALTKGLSFLGFNADIFMGLFEDQDYLQEIGNEQAIKNADNAQDEMERQAKDHRAWVSKKVDAINAALTENELRGIYTSVFKKLQRLVDNDGILAIQEAKDAKKAELENKGK